MVGRDNSHPRQTANFQYIINNYGRDVKYHVPTIILFLSGVFRRETASGFYPWGKVDSPRKRVA